MKLSTVMIAGAALAGAAAIAGGASAATVFEQYDYLGFGAFTDGATLFVTNTSGSAYTDVTIGGQDFGALAAGASTAEFFLGDNESGSQGSALVTITAGGTTVSGTFTDVLGDPDVATAGVSLGDLATAVPEPGTWALLLAGFAGLGVALRLSRRKIAVAA